MNMNTAKIRKILKDYPQVTFTNEHKHKRFLSNIVGKRISLSGWELKYITEFAIVAHAKELTMNEDQLYAHKLHLETTISVSKLSIPGQLEKNKFDEVERLAREAKDAKKILTRVNRALSIINSRK